MRSRATIQLSNGATMGGELPDFADIAAEKIWEFLNEPQYRCCFDHLDSDQVFIPRLAAIIRKAYAPRGENQ